MQQEKRTYMIRVREYDNGITHALTSHQMEAGEAFEDFVDHEGASREYEIEGDPGQHPLPPARAFREYDIEVLSRPPAPLPDGPVAACEIPDGLEEAPAASVAIPDENEVK